MNQKKDWLKCSAVAIGFYLAVYVLLAHFYFGFFNPWLILVCLVLGAGDIVGLRWFINRYGKNEHDDYP